MKKLALHWKIIIGMVLGVVYGLIASKYGWIDFSDDWIKPWGVIFVNLLKLIAVPLVFASLMKGVASLSDISKLSRIGGKTIAIYLTSTVIAVSIGLLLVNTVKPGDGFQKEKDKIFIVSSNVLKIDSLSIVKNSLVIYDSENVVVPISDFKINEANSEIEVINSALFDTELRFTYKIFPIKQNQKQKEGTDEKIADAGNVKDSGPLQFLIDVVPTNIFDAAADNRNMLQVIFFAIFFGIAMVMLPDEKTTYVKGFFDGINDIILQIVDIIMMAAPYGVFALLGGLVVEFGASADLGFNSEFKLNSKLMLFSFSHSDAALPDSWRVLANMWNIKLSNQISLNLSGQIWDQPNIKFYQNDKLITSEGFGGQFISTVNYDINKNLYGFTLQLGYKSTGYAIGEQLNKGLIIRGGLTFKLGNKSL